MTCPVFNNLRKRYTQSMYMYNIFHQADFYHKHIKVYFLNKVFLKIESSLITRNTYYCVCKREVKLQGDNAELTHFYITLNDTSQKCLQSNQWTR